MDIQIEDQYINGLMDEYLKKLLIVNETINLTRVTDLQQAKLLHIEDSLSVLEEMSAAPEGLYGDLGSGGGFPGVILALATGRETILIDSVKKKMDAVSRIIEEMDIENIRTMKERIEDITIQYPNTFSVLTARALSSLPSLMELSSPLLIHNGILIAMKSHVSEDELSQAKTIQKKTGMRLIKSRDFYLSDNETYRSIYVFEKYKKPDIKLPRKIGMAQKHPLS